MTYTAEQLREEALSIEREGRDADEVDSKWLIGLLRAHADAIELAEASDKRLVACQAHVAELIGKHADAIERAERAEAELAKLQLAINLAARVMRGEGVEDQAQAWDVCLRILDAARADFPEGTK